MIRKRTLLAVALALSISLGLASPVTASATRGDASSNNAAQFAKKKKKCKKGKVRKRGKCVKKGKSKSGGGNQGGGGSQAQDPVAQLRTALAGSKLSRYYGNASLTSSGEQHYYLCASGSFSFHGESLTNYTSSVTNAQGTWQVVSAQFNAQATAAEGIVSYTSNNPDFPAGQGKVTLVGSNQAFIDGTEFQRTIGGAGC